MLANLSIKQIKWTCVVAVFFLFNCYFLHRGVKFAGDTYRYSPWADSLIKNHFKWGPFLKENPFAPSLIHYSTWIWVVAQSKIYFGKHWGLAIILYNVILFNSAVIILFNLIEKHCKHMFPLIFCTTLLLCLPHFYAWVSFILSDTSFACLTFFLFTLSINLSAPTSKKLWQTPVTGILALFILFYRPTALPAILATSLLLIYSKVKPECFSRKLFIWTILIYSALFILASILMPYFFAHFSNVNINLLKLWDHKGIVIETRPETYVNTHAKHYLSYITTIKFFYYLGAFYNIRHSLLHRFINTLVFGSAYFFTLFAAWQCFIKNFSLLNKKMIIYLSVNWILLYAMYQGLTVVVADMRYQVPIILPLLIVTAVGLDEFILTFKKGKTLEKTH